MSRSLLRDAPKPLHPDLITGREEGNIGPLALICLQERIPESYTTWKVDVHLGAVEGEVSCLSPSEVGGVPHGIDGDVAMVLQMLYLEQGSPSDGWVETTPYTLLTRAGLEVSGRYYHRLEASLRRLNSAIYTVKSIWLNRSRNRHETVRFAFLAQVETVSQDAAIGEGSTLRVKLADPLIKNVLVRHLRPLDVPFLVSLNRPTTRGLYRLLNAVRLAVANEGRPPLRSYRVGVQDWATACKMIETEVARIRRNLNEAHQELVARGFLEAVEWQGRGSKATLEYFFSDPEALEPFVQPGLPGRAAPSRLKTLNRPALESETPQKIETPDTELHPELVAKLRSYGVAQYVAQNLLQAWGAEHIEACLNRFATLLQAGSKFRSKPAVLVDLIRSPAEKYILESPLFPDPAQDRSNHSISNLTTTGHTNRSDIPADQPLEQTDQTRTLEEQTGLALAQAGVMLHKFWSPSLKEKLKIALQNETLDPYTFVQSLNLAGYNHTLEDFALELKQKIS